MLPQANRRRHIANAIPVLGRIEQIILLKRIGIQIEQLALIARTQIQLPPVARHNTTPRQRRHQIDIGIPQIAVTNPIPLHKRHVRLQIALTRQRTCHTLTLTLVRNRQPCQIQKRRNQIRVTKHPIHPRLLRTQPRHMHQKRNARRLLVKRPLLPHAVIARHLAVITRKHKNRILHLTRLIQRLHHLTNGIIHNFHIAQILRPQLPPVLIPRHIFSHNPRIRGIAIKIRTHPVKQRMPLWMLQKRRSHRNLLGVVQPVIRSPIRRMRLKRTRNE